MVEYVGYDSVAKPKAKPNWVKRIILAVLIVPVVLLALLIGSAYVVTWDMTPEQQAASTRQYKNRETVKTVITLDLKDPASAEFRWLVSADAGRIICGAVNAKNSFGGYTGFKRFYGDFNAPASIKKEPEGIASVEQRIEFDSGYEARCVSRTDIIQI